MKKIRIKNDISVIWEITYKDENDISQPYNLEGKNITVTLSKGDYTNIPMDIEIHENTVRFTFKGINQIHCGIYRATLHEVGSNGELKTVDVCDIFELVPYTCQANLDDNDIIVDEVNLFSEITLGIYALTAQDKLDIANIVIDNATMQEVIRKTITPYHASVYLPNNVPFTTALIPINTPTKIKLPTVIKTEHGFGVVDRGGTSGYALQYQGTKPITLRVFATTGVNASVNNTTFNTFIYKNDVLEDGLGASAKLGTGTDVVTITSGGTMTVNPLDFIEIWISTNSRCRYTFSRTSIMLYEA